VSGKGFTEQKLNLTLALCAVLISIASFYATYLQADSAEKQVKAMTLPLIQHFSGNFNDESKSRIITFTLENAGVGPALIKGISYNYKGTEYSNRSEFLSACCSKERDSYHKIVNNGAEIEVGSISSTVLNTIIPAQTKVNYFQLYHSEFSDEYWNKLNYERFEVGIKICYCSLLDECYITERNGVVEPVKSCPVINPKG